jgi:site-specific DNA-cytosine methylase
MTSKRTNMARSAIPAELVLRNVLEMHGSEIADADLIVASPPCTEYSYMAMPWSRAKQIARALRGEDEFPEPYAARARSPS